MPQNDNQSPIRIPKLKKSTIIFDEFAKIRRDTLLFYEKVEYNYYTLVTKPAAVVILALRQDGQIVLNNEYRHPTSRILLSCPGGFLSEDEAPELGAKRELIEETGYDAKSFQVIGEAYPFPGITGQKIFFVRALDAFKTSNPDREPTELIRTITRTLSEVEQEILSGSNVDALLCTALYYHMLQKKTSGEYV
ncbi:MAG: ADP-ribose pyrophosphatase [Halioglobus sp.]|jgi:ADP-ribose pyrophosphatase